MRTNLNLQVCLYPHFDGGLYVTGPTKYMLQIRVSLGFIDFRIWWDSRGATSGAGPFDSYAKHPGPAVQIPQDRSVYVPVPMAVDIVYVVGRTVPAGFDIAENQSNLVIFQTKADAESKAAELGSEWEAARFSLMPASKLPIDWEAREVA